MTDQATPLVILKIIETKVINVHPKRSHTPEAKIVRIALGSQHEGVGNDGENGCGRLEDSLEPPTGQSATDLDKDMESMKKSIIGVLDGLPNGDMTLSAEVLVGNGNMVRNESNVQMSLNGYQND